MKTAQIKKDLENVGPKFNTLGTDFFLGHEIKIFQEFHICLINVVHYKSFFYECLFYSRNGPKIYFKAPFNFFITIIMRTIKKLNNYINEKWEINNLRKDNSMKELMAKK